MKKMRLIPAALAILSLAFANAVLADEHEDDAPPPLSSVWLIVPKTGMEGEFAAAVGEHMAMRAEAGDTRTWSAYRPVIGYNLKPIQFRACCFDWADEDAYQAQAAEKGFGADWNENVHPYVDHYHHYIETADWENSHWPEGMDGPYYGVTEWHYIEGSGPASGEARREIVRILKETGWASDTNNWLWLFNIGGSQKTILASSYDSYAAMEQPEVNAYQAVAEEVGEEKAAELFADFNSAYSKSTYTVWEYDEAMSMPESE